jgi:hypothetical protein
MSVSGKINVSALSFDEKMTLLSELAKSLVGQGSSVKTVKTVADAKPKKEKDPNAPKREVPLSFTARTAFIAKIKVSHAERFAEDKAAGIKYLVTAKNIIDENKSDFDAFVSEFIAHHGSSPASNAAAAPAAVSKPAAASSAAPAAPAPAATPKKLTAADLKAKKPATATPPKPAAAKPTPAAPKKAAKPAAPVQDESMDRITIFEEDYFRDTKTQALWKVDDEGNQGPFVGYFQAGDEDEPIRYAEHPEDE